MSDLIAIAYPDEATAERVRGRVIDGMKQKIIEVEDLVIVTADENGKVKLHQSAHPAAAGAAGGALWGGLIGLIFLVPFLGAAVGAAAGGLAGSSVDLGINDNFLKELGEKLTPGSAALIMLVTKVTPDKVLPNIQEQGHVIQSSLSDEAEAHLNQALEAAGSKSEAGAPA